MKPRATHPFMLIHRYRSEKLLLTLVCLGLLTACVAPPLYEDEMLSQPDAAADPNAATYPPQPSPSASGTESPAAESSQFAFPLPTCGDRTSEPSGTWYSVFVDGGNIEEIRSQYCGDAISATRDKSGIPTVQVASFTSYAKALSLAKAVGGVVEQTTQPSPNPAQPGTQPPANRPPHQAGNPAQVGQTAYLSASDPTAPINIRSSASTEADIQATGIVGERVQISNQVQGSDGYTWYEVRSESGAAGWVRGDLVAAQPPAVQQSPDPSAPRRTAPMPTPNSPNYSQPPYSQPPYSQAPPAQSPPAQSPYTQPPYTQPPYSQAPNSPLPYPPSYAQPPYSQPPYPQQPPSNGGPPYGMGGSAVLTARDPGSAINIREYASPNSRVRRMAAPGEPVQIFGSAQGEDGHIWYQVGVGGGMGWVRSDLVVPN
ncbi:SH3 domain-containing protein [Leptolyngbya sp. NK1-12]|uniref:SH3 domain-containing protein n=1 Tax=Leptolyngbya sp. NK1-12 TaxID=2547451 RepID=A0AA96WCB2_9CYAN|nr:SH3 domain-containing protein [Leptolyngbya sp. NK1-12]